ncbi:MAG: hypothetical protein ACK559_36870, partial [bacterium]
IAMFATIPGKDGWFSGSQSRKLGKAFDMSITGIKIHGSPRHHTYTAPQQGSGRLSVMIDEVGEVFLQEDLNGTRRKTPKEWKGITVFYETDPNQTCYLDTPDGLIKCVLTQEEIADVAAVYACWKGVHFFLAEQGKRKGTRSKMFQCG